ncbi:hypothetical protein ACHAXH_004707 [Discostella pseudostelligera]
MENYLRQIADETTNLFVANKASTKSRTSSSYTKDNIMFAAAIDDDDNYDNAEEFQSETSDSIASFAEWFFSDDDHLDEDGGASPSPTNHIGNCCSPIGERSNGAANRTTKRRMTKQSENHQYTEFIQCAKSSIDIVSYILDPLGDMFRGTKFCINSWDDERRYHPVAHHDETKKTPSPEMNHFSKDLSLESNNECNTTFTTTSTKSCSLDTSTASSSPLAVDMTAGHAIENEKDISDELDDGRLGIAPMIMYSNNLTNDDDGGDLVRKLFASGENDFVVSFGTNVYRESYNEQQFSKTLSQMLIETNYLLSLTEDAPHSHHTTEDDRIALSLDTRTNEEVRTAPSPDPHAIYCRPPRQRLRLEERKFRKTPYSTSDSHAIYCCQPRVRIRHEKTHDNIKDKNNNTAANDDNRVLREQPTATSVASTNAPTLPVTTTAATTTTAKTTTSATTIYTVTGGWSGDKLKKAKLKRRAKIMKARLITP